MTKATFTGYFPKLKAHREATVKSGKAINPKGSIRYQIKGECMDDEKGLCISLPKMVTREDFEKVYGFDAKAAEAVIIQGKKGKEDAVQLHIVGIEDNTDFTPEKIVPIKTMNEYGHKKLTKEIMGGHATKSNHADTVGSPSPADVEPPAPSEKPFPQEPSNENFSAETEVKEAFGLFGDKDEEKEEEKEPETQEFTVVLQEGDKLELTDVEETADAKDEDEGADEENEEKASDCDDHFYEAVQAKVTRPVKEDETEDEEEEESEEGMSTLTKVGLGVGALAIGAAILGAEDEGELDYWDGENAEWRAEGGGQIDHDSIDTIEDTEVHFRHDNPTTDYEWTSGKDELTDDEEDIVDDEVRWDIGSEPSEGEDSDSIDVDGVGTVHYTKDTDYGDKRFYGLAAEGEDFQKMTPSEFVPFDQMQEELGQMWDETTAPLADAHNYDYEPSNEPSNANFSAEWTQEDNDKWNEEISRRQKEIEAHEGGTDNLHEYSHVGSYEDYQKEHQAIIWAWKKELQEGQDDGKSPEDLYWINDAWVKQITELNRYWSDIDSGKYHAQYPIATLSADTVGSPSPSGPSPTPEPAEATGSEPSNEHMEADSKTKNMVLGTVALGIGLSVILGKDRINKWFDRFGL